MKTHEIAEDEGSQVDFCWDLNYIQMNEAYSYVMNNATPYQAYRAGFREGVKMSLDRGYKVDPDNFEKSLHDKNFYRLLIWSNIGRDVENGLWAMYGTRLGCYLTNLDPNFDYVNVRDFKWHTEYFQNEVMPQFAGGEEHCVKSKYTWNKQKLLKETERLGTELRRKLNIPIAEIDEEGSKFHKKVYYNPPRSMLVTEKDDQGRIIYKSIKQERKMSNFEKCLEIILHHEGGYVNHPKDPGGETNLGVTKRVYEEWGGTKDMKDLTVEDVAPIYKKNYLSLIHI